MHLINPKPGFFETPVVLVKVPTRAAKQKTRGKEAQNTEGLLHFSLFGLHIELNSLSEKRVDKVSLGKENQLTREMEGGIKKLKMTSFKSWTSCRRTCKISIVAILELLDCVKLKMGSSSNLRPMDLLRPRKRISRNLKPETTPSPTLVLSANCIDIIVK